MSECLLYWTLDLGCAHVVILVAFFKYKTGKSMN